MFKNFNRGKVSIKQKGNLRPISLYFTYIEFPLDIEVKCVIGNIKRKIPVYIQNKNIFYPVSKSTCTL